MESHEAYLDRLSDEILSPTVRAGFDHWRSLLAGRSFPQRRELKPESIARQLLRTTLIDVSYDPLDFRVRLVGQHVREHQGLTATQRVADCILVAEGRDSLLRRFTACALQRRPIRGLYRYVPRIVPNEPLWVEAVSCPLSDDGATVNHIVSFGSDADFTVPEGARELP